MLIELAKADTRVLEVPAPVVQVMELGDSQVEYVLRAYTNPADALPVRLALNEQIKIWMEERKLHLPMPQLQVHSNPALQTSSVTPLPGSELS